MRLKTILLLIPIILSSTGCEPRFYRELACYYLDNLDNTAVEVYCWQEENLAWFAGLIYPTSCFKSIEEISYMQEEKPCPIGIMSEILDMYSDIVRQYAGVFIVSVPPLEIELRHDRDLILQNIEKYREVYRLLRLPFPEETD